MAIGTLRRGRPDGGRQRGIRLGRPRAGQPVRGQLFKGQLFNGHSVKGHSVKDQLLGGQPGAPLAGPGSLHWRYAGDRRSYLMGPYAGVLQLMHPGLDAGVEQHSAFFTEPWERFLRSVPQILGVTYDWPNANQTARNIRDRHLRITGVDRHGRHYHALDPEVYFWAHATMIMALIRSVELFHRPLSDAQRERLYAESCLVYRRYGVSDRAMPADWAAFGAYYDRICADVLEPTATALRLAHLSDAPPRSFPGLPDQIFRVVSPLAARAGWWLIRATVPPVVRDRLGGTWTRRDERLFALFTGTVRRVFRLLPVRLRYDPRARVAFRRTGIGPQGAGNSEERLGPTS